LEKNPDVTLTSGHLLTVRKFRGGDKKDFGDNFRLFQRQLVRSEKKFFIVLWGAVVQRAILNFAPGPQG
jgi:hypothetical protein